jgi:cytochrome d ubiquinol oxidase subunit II
LTHGKYLQPFLAALGLFVLSFVGLGISFYPYILPGTLTIKQAAAPESSMTFLLVGAVVLLPMILPTLDTRTGLSVAK